MEEVQRTVLRSLQPLVGEAEFRRWLEPLRLVEIKGGVVAFEASSSFRCDWVSRQFGDLILGQVRQVVPSAVRLEFRTARPARPMEPTRSVDETSSPTKTNHGDESDPFRQGDRRWLRINPDQTFDSYVVGKPNYIAYHAAFRTAQEGPVDFNPLFLHGGVGVGKTHLLHAIAWALRGSRPDAKILFLTAEQFMFEFVRAIQVKNMLEFKEHIRSVDTLLIDDVQFVAGKDSTQEEFFHTFNVLKDRKRQIVMTGDRPPGDFDRIDNRIISRMQSGLAVHIDAPDYELRFNFLKRKMKLLAQSNSRVSIADDVLDFVARKIASNIRVLEGALNRLTSLASLRDNPTVSVGEARMLLADLLRLAERKVSIDEIIRCTAEHFNLRQSDLVGPKRSQQYARPRHIAMFLAKNLTAKSYPSIGRHFGGRDHTTVIHGVRRIEKLKASDHNVARTVRQLRNALETRWAHS